VEALREYPELRTQFGEEWFLGNLSKREGNRHVLIELLLQEEPKVEHINGLFNDLKNSLKRGKIKDFISRDLQIGKLLYFSKFLQNFETDLEKLKGVKGFSRMIEKLRESDCDEFFCRVRKIEIASVFFEHFEALEIESGAAWSKTIFKVKKNDRTIHFVFVTSDIVDEFAKEIARESSYVVPMVAMIDSARHSKSKTRELYEVERLSGLVIYDQVVQYGTPIQMGFLIENPKARNKLLADETSILCQSLHLIRFPVAELIQVFSKKSVQERLKKGGFYATQSFLNEIFAEHFGGWMKTPNDIALIFLQLIMLLSRQSDKYEYQCFMRSSLLHLSALTVNAENWWRELMRLGDSLALLQDGIAQIQNLETILLSKRKASEEVKISLLLPLYTSTLEGIFQRMARVIVAEMNIILGKSSKDVPVAGVPKLVQRINSFNEGELRILTKGYSQTLRNAYSHSTYHIDLHKKEIIAKDRKKEEVFTFPQLKKMRKRLDKASYMAALSLVVIFFRLASPKSKTN
jgi:vacuolar-type H+-ATPase subunit F/Vma7